MRRLLLALPLALMAAAPALAHNAGAVPPIVPGWTLDPWVIVPLLISAGLYAFGFSRLYARSGGGRARLVRSATLYAGGWAVLALAVVSPLHQAGERSFAAHMVEHELLMLAAAPLLVASRPVAIFLWAFPPQARQALGGVGRQSWFTAPWRALTEPITATLVQAAALWLWHAPTLFDAALASDGWHVAQHLSFLVSALLFWSAMLDGRGARALGLAALCLFATSVVSGALGALMAFSQSPWYQGYAALGLAPFGLTPVEDQQLAGLLMWIPGGLVHAGAALILLSRLLREPSRASGAPSEGISHAVH